MRLVRAMTEFRYEREMLAPARRWLSNQGMMVKEEFTTPWGVCDLVAVSLDQEHVRERLQLGQRAAIGPLTRVRILSAIPKVETNASEIVKTIMSSYRGVLTPSHLREEIDRLIAGKFVKEGERGTLQRINGWAPLHRRLVALELKLSRVQDALAQAASHQAFAEGSYVGLPTDVAERIVTSQRAASFRSEGVGILSVGKDGCRIVLRPKARRYPLNPALQMHCVERFWRSWLRGSAS